MRYLLAVCVLVLLIASVGCGSSASPQRTGSLVITVSAGPVCPVERVDDPTCAPRMVKGARLRLEGPATLTLTTDTEGTARSDPISVGIYRVVAEPVDGLLGVPPPVTVVIRGGRATHLAVSYDTGIR